jgi:hypothetical protein
MSFSVLIPIGKSALDLDRLRDLLESLFRYEPDVAEIVIVDDVMPARDFSHLTLPPPCRLVVLPNPRRGAGDGWLGGLAAAVIEGNNWLQKNSICDFVLKLDTDALVIAPFAAKVSAAFAARPGAFLLGSSTKTPNRIYDLPEDFPTAPALRKLQRPFTIWRRTCQPWPRLQCILFPRDSRRRALIRAAVRNGYRLGLHCQGGAYALSRHALNQFAAAGILADPLLWIWTPCGEDIVMTVSAYACGGVAGDLNDDGQPFGTLAHGLPDSPARLITRGFSVIHSVKDFEETKETETREFFRRRRLSDKN